MFSRICKSMSRLTTFLHSVLAFLMIAVGSNCDASSESEVEILMPFLQQFCTDCHGVDLSEAGLQFDSLDLDFNNRENTHLWDRILTQVQLRDMPPEDVEQPSRDKSPSRYSLASHNYFESGL